MDMRTNGKWTTKGLQRMCWVAPQQPGLGNVVSRGPLAVSAWHLAREIPPFEHLTPLCYFSFMVCIDSPN